MFCCQVMGIFLFQVKWYKEIMDSGEIICEGRYIIIYYYYCKYLLKYNVILIVYLLQNCFKLLV